MADYNETPVSRPAHRNNAPWRKRKGGRPLGVVDHHIVGSLPGCTSHFQNGSTGYATNYGIGSGNGRGGGGWWIHEYVPDDQVAWGNGNTFLNEYAVSIEHENNLAVGIAAKPTPEVHELSARFLAHLARKWDWRINGKLQLVVRDFPNHDFYGRSVPGFGTEFNVITHRSVALKDCPKDFDIHWQVRRANQILAGSSTAGGTGTIIEEADVAKRVTFQESADFRVRPDFQRFPHELTPRQENIASGTGSGLFDVIVNLYLKEFGDDSQVQGRLVVVNAKTEKASADHEFTVNGHHLGTVQAAIPCRFDVPDGSYVYLELRTSAGAEPVLDYWGADVAVLTVA